MKKAILILLVLAFQAVVISTAFAQKPKVVVSDKEGWHKIGEVNADFKKNKETISVLGADKFKAIKFKASEGPIKIERATVAYENGLSEEIAVNNDLTVGEETKTFNLKSAADIKTIEFTYASMPNYRTEKAHVEIYGMK